MRGLFTYSMKQKMILGVSSVVSEKGLIFGMFSLGGRRLIFVQRCFGVSLETLGFFFLRGGGVG